MTRVKMLYDDESMYIAARLQEENVWAHLTKRDTIVYYDNDFEIFLDPTANCVDYFEFEVTCLNTMFDMFHENDNNRGALADRRYDSPGTRHAVSVQGTLNYHHDIDDGWTVELSIPFEDLAAWNTVHSGSIHVPEMWGKVLFSDRVAGAVEDAELERGFGLLDPPDPLGRREPGMAHFASCSIALGPDPTDPKHSPIHQIQVPEFWMDRHEVTVAEYADFLNRGGNDEYYEARMAIPELCGLVRDGPGRYRALPGRDDYPVVFTRQPWALAYAEVLGKTLPTEAMWERAAIGLVGRPYPWGNDPLDPSRANYDFHYGGALPVGSLPAGATPEGLFDMIGNAREWTVSKIHPYPGGAEYEYHIAPWWFPGQKKFDRIWWVARGGGWSQQEACMSPKYRNSLTVMDGGFRCVRVESGD